MSLPLVDQVLQLTAWLLSLIMFILALYVLLLNTRHLANRHASALFLLLAINNFAQGLMLGTTDAIQAALPASLLAAISPAIQPGLLIIAIVLLKPRWLDGRWRRIWWSVYGLVILPILLTLMDVGLNTHLWYTGLDAAAYTGGYVSLFDYTAGSLSLPVRVLNFYGTSVITIVLLLYVVLRDKELTPLTRRLARLFLGAQIVGIAFQMGLQGLLDPAARVIIINLVFALAYAYAAFQEMISARRWQRGRLQPRLTALMLAVTVPLLVAVTVFVSSRAGAVIEQSAEERLQQSNRALAVNISTWLDLNIKALQQLVTLPDIIGMDARRQKPLLEAMDAAYPHMYLISTTDWKGINIARSDDVPPKDYSDRLWQIGARNGRDVTYQTLIGRTSGEPALVVSMPIRRELGTIVGVGMFASDLTDITQEVLAVRIGESGFAYVVDALNQVVAHPDPAFSASLTDFSTYPPVFALRGGTRGKMNFTDEDGIHWRAYVDELDNGWGIVVQQPEAELLGVLRAFLRVSGVIVGVGAFVLALLVWLTIRQTFQPIGALTDTATAIAAGDLTRTAPVESDDEIGVLAGAFNRMTDRLRELIGSLEDRVAERTAELERRAVQLQAAAEVGRVTASVLDQEKLLNQVVELIRERFDFYYVGLFLLDETRRWAELQAATGEAGRVMVEHGHRLEVGGASMIGWCAAHAQARIALDVGDEAVRFENPLLPDTRSEMALPLVARGRAIGALTVQSAVEDAFSREDVTVLQTMADQIAVAIDNARLFAEAQESLNEAQAVHRHYLREAWTGFGAGRESEMGYRYSVGEVEPDPEAWLPAMSEARQQNKVVIAPDTDGANTLSLPITLRGESIGLLGFKKEGEGGWTDDDVAVAQAVADQVALSLENVRLFDEAQRRAQREALTRELSEKMRRTTDVNAILETAIQGLGKALGSARAFVRLDAHEEHGGSGINRAPGMEGQGDGKASRKGERK